MMVSRIFLAIAAVLGGLSVAAGAFGAHALRERLSERSLEIFETASRYQMYHALALVLVALLINREEFPQLTLVASGWSFIIGILIFSGSLYALSFTDMKVLGAFAPLGGVAFIAGWSALAIAAFNFK
jgi:uncharacterized membrane protein YgdD (TMEM256/DUF423 family)